MLICPLYKAALLASDRLTFVEQYQKGRIERQPHKCLIECDEGECSAWNPVTGTCGLNNYSVTPLLNER